MVRTEAGRLRRALERYYLVAGQADPVRSRCRRAATSPFSPAAPPRAGIAGCRRTARGCPTSPRPAGHRPWRAATVALGGSGGFGGGCRPAATCTRSAIRGHRRAALPDEPTLLVMPFESLSEGDDASLYAAGLTEEILTRLSRSKDLAVLGARRRGASGERRSGGGRARAGRPLLGDGQPARFRARAARDQPPRGHQHGHGPVGADLRGGPACQGAVRDPGGYRAACRRRHRPTLRRRVPIGTAEDGGPTAR